MTPEASAARLVHFTLRGPVGPLEAVLQQLHDGEHDITAVVCHPHPLYGGTLHNKVVHRVAATFASLGAAVLRFNFRGVGKSAGVHDRGIGELEDARAAWNEMHERWPNARRRWLAGFSFGAWVAARLAAELDDVERLLMVAPPVGTASFEVLRRASVPKLVIQGSADVNCPSDKLVAEFPTWAEPKKVVLVPGATHFFDKQLEPLGNAVLELFQS